MSQLRNESAVVAVELVTGAGAAGINTNPLVVKDNDTLEALGEIIRQLKIQNLHLSQVTGENIKATDME